MEDKSKAPLLTLSLFFIFIFTLTVGLVYRTEQAIHLNLVLTTFIPTLAIFSPTRLYFIFDFILFSIILAAIFFIGEEVFINSIITTGVNIFTLFIAIGMSDIARLRTQNIDQAKTQELLLRTVTSFSQKLLLAQNWESIIIDRLKELAIAANVSRAYIFQNKLNDNGQLTTSQIFEWTTDTVSAEINNSTMQDLNYGSIDYPKLEQTLSQRKFLIINTAELSKTMYDMFTSQNIKSSLLAPIFIKDSWWGFIGFDECVEEKRIWDARIADTLMTTGDIIGTVIRRSKIEKELKKKTNNLERINQTLIDREIKMTEMKAIINNLQKK